MINITNKLISLIDLTSLNCTDSNTSILQLCSNVHSPYGDVASICVYSHFIPIIKQLYQNINIATVVNFPHGMIDIDLAIMETELAINRGADEIDMVFPYHAFLQGDITVCAKMITIIKQLCKNKILKVIIESGTLNTDHLITQASQLAIDNGANFIKTSTGKAAIHATPQAVETILKVIYANNSTCGIKISGGVNTIEPAIKYIELITLYMGEKWINAQHVRFGTSKLLGDILKR